MTRFIPFEGGFHGPPDELQPEQFGTQTSRPSRRASDAAWRRTSNQAGELNATSPGGTAQPASNIWTPPTPAFASSSKSRVMPAFVTLPFIMWYQVCGRAAGGGLRKPASSDGAAEVLDGRFAASRAADSRRKRGRRPSGTSRSVSVFGPTCSPPRSSVQRPAGSSTVTASSSVVTGATSHSGPSMNCVIGFAKPA